MENFNFIEWTDLSTSRGGRGPKLKDFEVAIYRNINPEKKSASNGNYMSFSLFMSEVYANETKIKVGRINNKVVFQFNKIEGLQVRAMAVKDGKHRCSSRTSSLPLVDMVLKCFNLEMTRNTYRFSLVDLGNNTFLIDKLIPE